jgi:ribosomal protein S18 acetylase RimI-like enzyme
MPEVVVMEADLANPLHQEAIVMLINAYACDAMGGGRPLPEQVRTALIPGLRQHPTTLVLLAWSGPQPVGIAVCFGGFSTFAARPLLNIHDLAVLPTYRRQGVGRLLLEHAAAKARALGGCKLTLEVRADNGTARQLYERSGFGPMAYASEATQTLFLEKPL